MLANSKCRLCSDRSETVNHILNEGSKVAQKNKHEWVEKVIHKELCSKLKYHHTDKWYMLKQISVFEN